MSKGLTDTDIGIRIPEKQKKKWTSEQLKAGDSIIGLQVFLSQQQACLVETCVALIFTTTNADYCANENPM